MQQAQEWRMSPWQVKGIDNPTRWERLLWRKRWELWISEVSARQERIIEDTQLRMMNNGR